MNREQMVEAVTNILPYHWRSKPPGGECSCGHVTPLGRMTSEHVARAVLDAILPQATTVAELEALPTGSVLLSTDGRTWHTNTRVLHNQTVWESNTGTLRNVGALLAEPGVNPHPLTVVWQPEVTK